MGVGKKVVFMVFAVLMLPVVQAFDVAVSPGTLQVNVQAGGYVAELIEIQTDAPVQVVASASPALANILRLTRHNETAFLVHVLPPIDGGNYDIDGQLVLDVQGQAGALTASVQRVQLPLNVSVSVKGRADSPAQVSLGEEIEIVPLAADTATLIVAVIAGIIILNIILRRKTKGKS